MTGDSSGAGDDLMGLLSTLDRAEILEVLSGSEGFCQNCQALLQSRIRTLSHGTGPPSSIHLSLFQRVFIPSV